MKIFVYIMIVAGILNCNNKNSINENTTNIEIDGYFKHESNPRQYRFSIKNDKLILNSVNNDALNEKKNVYQLSKKMIKILNAPPKILLNQNKTLGKGYYGRYYIFTFHHNTKPSTWKIDVMYKFTDTNEHESYLNHLTMILQNIDNENKLKELNVIAP